MDIYVYMYMLCIYLLTLRVHETGVHGRVIAPAARGAEGAEGVPAPIYGHN